MLRCDNIIVYTGCLKKKGDLFYEQYLHLIHNKSV